jgi:hypothetical protein
LGITEFSFIFTLADNQHVQLNIGVGIDSCHRGLNNAKQLVKYIKIMKNIVTSSD